MGLHAGTGGRGRPRLVRQRVFLVQPLRPEYETGYEELHRRCATPLAAGESNFTLDQAMRLVANRTLSYLQEDGLVRALSKRGVQVCPLAPGDIREIYYVIIAIEARADELEDATSRMEQALQKDDLHAWATADDQFHRIVVGRCGNSRIRRIAQTITDQAHRARVMTLRLRPKPTGSAAAHGDIIRATKEGRAAEAHHHARQHRINARDELLPLIENFGIKHL